MLLEAAWLKGLNQWRLIENSLVKEPEIRRSSNYSFTCFTIYDSKKLDCMREYPGKPAAEVSRESKDKFNKEFAYICVYTVTGSTTVVSISVPTFAFADHTTKITTTTTTTIIENQNSAKEPNHSPEQPGTKNARKLLWEFRSLSICRSKNAESSGPEASSVASKRSSLKDMLFKPRSGHCAMAIKACVFKQGRRSRGWRESEHICMGHRDVWS